MRPVLPGLRQFFIVARALLVALQVSNTREVLYGGGKQRVRMLAARLDSESSGRCRACMDKGIDIQSAPSKAFCDRCLETLAPGLCPRCAFQNGELDDACRHCSASLNDDLLQQPGRKLKPNSSHPEAPVRKAIDHKVSNPSETTPASAADEQQHSARTEDMQIAEMMKIMMLDMKEMKGQMATEEDVNTLKAGIEDAKTLAQNASNAAQEATNKAAALATHFNELKQQVVTKEDASRMIQQEVEAKLARSGAQLAQDTQTVLFGGLETMSFAAAQEWVTTRFKALSLPPPSDVYIKGDEFSGILFAKLDSANTVEQVTRTKHMNGTSQVWCKKDKPFKERTALSFLLGLRRQLKEWGYKRSIRVSEHDLSLLFHGKPVLSASVSDTKLSLHWIDKHWSEWAELQESAELTGLVQKANDSIKKYFDAVDGKGEGKGKSASSA